MFNNTDLESMEETVNLWIKEHEVNNIVDVTLSSEFMKMQPDGNNTVEVTYHYTVCIRYKKAVDLEEINL
jgi:hypothetical protein